MDPVNQSFYNSYNDSVVESISNSIEDLSVSQQLILIILSAGTLIVQDAYSTRVTREILQGKRIGTVKRTFFHITNIASVALAGFTAYLTYTSIVNSLPWITAGIGSGTSIITDYVSSMSGEGQAMIVLFSINYFVHLSELSKAIGGWDGKIKKTIGYTALTIVTLICGIAAGKSLLMLGPDMTFLRDGMTSFTQKVISTGTLLFHPIKELHHKLDTIGCALIAIYGFGVTIAQYRLLSSISDSFQSVPTRLASHVFTSLVALGPGVALALATGVLKYEEVLLISGATYTGILLTNSAM